MSTADDFLAARYALGVADLSEIVTAESRLDLDADFAARVAFYDSVFSVFHEDLPPEQPSDAVWDRIEAAIDDIEKSPGTRTIRADALAWEPYGPGIERKVLHIDKAEAIQIALYKLAPGAEVVNHTHILTEECLVVEGEVEVDGLTAGRGDVHLAFPGSRHGPLTSRTGAVLYVRADLEFRL